MAEWHHFEINVDGNVFKIYQGGFDKVMMRFVREVRRYDEDDIEYSPEFKIVDLLNFEDKLNGLKLEWETKLMEKWDVGNQELKRKLQNVRKEKAETDEKNKELEKENKALRTAITEKYEK